MAQARLVLSCAATLVLACGSVDPAGGEFDAPPDGYVVLDDAARAAGWSVRVGGSCFPHGGDEPVAVPRDEWVLVARWDGEHPEVQFLHPTPGLLLSVHGAELGVEVIELAEPIATDDAEDVEEVEEADAEGMLPELRATASGRSP